jgi:hypothetical protein
MNPILSQALSAQRIGDWRDRAARARLVKQARRDRRDAARRPAAPPAVAVPQPRSGSGPAAWRSAASAAGEPVVVASGSAADEHRPPAGGRAA